jgi:pimeloyl-ACP methyl ester carboxylesterase
MKNSTNKPKKGFVLIPGGGMGSWIWDSIVPRLRSPCLAIDKRTAQTDRRKYISDTTIKDCADHVINCSNTACFKELILVAHSGAGLILPEIVKIIPERVKHLIFISATILPDGKRAIDMLPLLPQLLNRFSFFLMSLGVEMPKKQVEKTIRKNFCNTCSESVIQFILKHKIQPEPKALAYERVTRKNMPSIPASYIKLLKDKTNSLTNQAAMIHNYGRPAVYEIDADHMVMLSRPDKLAAVLNTIAVRVFG